MKGTEKVKKYFKCYFADRQSHDGFGIKSQHNIRDASECIGPGVHSEWRYLVREPKHRFKIEIIIRDNESQSQYDERQGAGGSTLE